ncbi:MAG TPA: phosphotransferase [Candidatus Eisenbacteria bacterium]|jgi:hypothetical protein
MPSVRLGHPDLLADPAALGSVLGPIEALAREPIDVPGYSGARFERVSVRSRDGRPRKLVLKRARLDADWTAWRTADEFGRAILPLEAPALAGIWQAFANPYVAHAVAQGEVGLLMEDLSPQLLPDARAPLEERAEAALVDALARLHARYWESPALDEPRLAAAPSVLGMLGPRLAREAVSQASLSPVIERAIRGWELALRHLPSGIADRLSRPPEEIIHRWGALPRTLCHGDAKVANFAILPDGRVAAFDWGCMAAAPAALDLGWYLAVNATRILGSKESFAARYRGRLEAALERPLPEDTWTAIVDAAIEAGAMLLLWSKALALERDDPAARAEWNWWVEQLGRN